MKLEIALAIPALNDENDENKWRKNRTPTPVYLDPGMHPGLEVKGLTETCEPEYSPVCADSRNMWRCQFF